MVNNVRGEYGPARRQAKQTIITGILREIHGALWLDRTACRLRRLERWSDNWKVTQSQWSAHGEPTDAFRWTSRRPLFVSRGEHYVHDVLSSKCVNKNGQNWWWWVCLGILVHELLSVYNQNTLRVNAVQTTQNHSEELAGHHHVIPCPQLSWCAAVVPRAWAVRVERIDCGQAGRR